MANTLRMCHCETSLPPIPYKSDTLLSFQSNFGNQRGLKKEVTCYLTC